MTKVDSSRREFLKTAVTLAPALFLFPRALLADGVVGSLKGEVAFWWQGVAKATRELRAGSMPPLHWQARVEQLQNKVPLQELMEAVDFERVAAAFKLPAKGVVTETIRFPEPFRTERTNAFIVKLFAMDEGRSIIPHGHRNMASCHLVLKGDFHLRQYQKLGETDGHLLVRPTVDSRVGPGSSSSISDDHNNVHWLVNGSGTGTGFTLDVIVPDSNGEPYDILNLDPDRAHALPGGELFMPRLGVMEALEKYG